MPRRVDQREPWTKALKDAADRLHANPPQEDILREAAKRSKNFIFGLDVGNDMTPEEIAFCVALENFKHKYQCPFPTSSAVLAVLKSIGYVLYQSDADIVNKDLPK